MSQFGWFSRLGNGWEEEVRRLAGADPRHPRRWDWNTGKGSQSPLFKVDSITRDTSSRCGVVGLHCTSKIIMTEFVIDYL